MAVVKVAEGYEAPSRLLIGASALYAATSEIDQSSDQLAAMAAAVSAEFERQAGRSMARERLIETHILAEPVAVLRLTRPPLIELHSVKINDVDLVEGDDFYLISDAWASIQLRLEVRSRFGMCKAERHDWRHSSQPLRLEVEYTGGFVLPDWPEPPTLPAEISSAVLSAFREAATQSTRDTTIKSERIGDYAITYASAGSSQGGGGGSGGSGGLPAAQEMAALAASYRLINL